MMDIGSFRPVILVAIVQLPHNKIVQTMQKYTITVTQRRHAPINTTKTKTAIKTNTKGNDNDLYSNGSGINNNDY